MTIQEQADKILAGELREIMALRALDVEIERREKADDLLLRLAQDRDALLKALKYVADAMRQEFVLTKGMERAERKVLLAIRQAERPR